MRKLIANLNNTMLLTIQFIVILFAGLFLSKRKTYYINITAPYQASLVSPAFDVELVNR